MVIPVALTLLLGAPAGATQQPAQRVPLDQRFAFTDTMVPMRDGIRLRTVIARPRDVQGPLPILLHRSPYGDARSRAGFALDRWYAELAADGYIFAFQEIRGRHASEGVQATELQPRTDPRGTDETTDAYDTIEWLVRNVERHNGRVGILGVSYDGWLALMTLLEPHPALKAVSPQGTPADAFVGDDWYHYGAFRLAPSFFYATMMQNPDSMTFYPFDQHDTYEWFLDVGPLANLNRRYLRGGVPLWDSLLAHPTYDAYWRRQSVPGYLHAATVPTLHVAGFWDAEDSWGAVKIYETLEARDAAGRNFLVIGPWGHGRWNYMRSDAVARALAGSADPETYLAPARHFRRQIQAAWFARHLKDTTAGAWPEALVYQTGSNRWEEHRAWPPRDRVGPRSLYFRSGGRLSFDPPTTESRDSLDAYLSDPARPVPYTRRPIPGFWASERSAGDWKVEDQRFVHLRPDVVSWETEPLSEDVTLSGAIVAHLFASTTGSDADWVVKLIDVYPDSHPGDPEMAGYQLPVADEVLRAKFRRSLERPEPVVPNRVTEYVIDLGSRNHRFRAGHRIMIQVQSTWFPLIDRNPQTFVNIPAAAASDFRAATHRIHRTRRFASRVELAAVCETTPCAPPPRRPSSGRPPRPTAPRRRRGTVGPSRGA